MDKHNLEKIKNVFHPFTERGITLGIYMDISGNNLPFKFPEVSKERDRFSF